MARIEYRAMHPTLSTQRSHSTPPPRAIVSSFDGLQDRFILPRATPPYARREADFYEMRVAKDWGGKSIMHGRAPAQDSIILMSNDYLSLARHRDILRHQADILLASGNGLLMSAVFLRGENPQSIFETQMATFMRAERTVLCQSGWCANIGLLQAIADENTIVHIDAMAHMSLWEGVKCAGAKACSFRHNDPNHLERQIRKHGAGVIIVDSVYSTDGSVCPLIEVAEIAERHDCVLVVDESHSLGTHGPRGAGLVVELGLEEKVHFRTASLAKAFAGRAGVVTCSERFYLYFLSTSFPTIFSSTLLLHEIAGLQKALEVIASVDGRRAALRLNSVLLREGLGALGYNVDASKSQIIALEAGLEQRTIKLRDALEARNIFGSVFCAPATPRSRSLVRLSTNAALTAAQLGAILEACADIRDEVELEDWPSTRRGGRSKIVPHEQ